MSRRGGGGGGEGKEGGGWLLVGCSSVTDTCQVCPHRLGSILALSAGLFPRSSYTSDLKTGTPVAAMPGVCLLVGWLRNVPATG